MKKMVPRRSLVAWPITFAALFFLLFGPVSALAHDWGMFIAVLLTSATAGWLGIVAVRAWLDHAYPDEEPDLTKRSSQPLTGEKIFK